MPNIARSITVQSVRKGTHVASSNPRVVTRFTDADGLRYLHVGAPVYFDADGTACKRADAAMMTGAACLIDRATIRFTPNGTFHRPDGSGTIVRLAR